MGVARNLSWGGGTRATRRADRNSRQKAESGEGVLGEGQLFGRTKRPQNTSSGRKCRLIPVSRFDSAEPLDATGVTLRFCGTPVEKQCHTIWQVRQSEELWKHQTSVAINTLANDRTISVFGCLSHGSNNSFLKSNMAVFWFYCGFLFWTIISSSCQKK